MPAQRLPIIIGLVCLFFTACSSAEKPKQDFVGLSGKLAPQAETNYSKARVLWGKRPDTPTGLELCSEPRKAIALLDSAIAVESKYADAYMRRALAKSEITLHDAAITDASTAIRLAPTPDNYAYRGLIFLRAKNPAGARKDLQRSLGINDDQYLAWNFMGQLELQHGKKDAACKAFREACSNGDCAARDNAEKEGLCK